MGTQFTDSVLRISKLVFEMIAWSITFAAMFAAYAVLTGA